MKRRWIRRGVGAMLLAAVLAGCAGQAARESGEKEPPVRQEAVQEEKTLVFGDTTFNAENGESDINPHHDSGGWACIRYGVGETLFRFTDQMEIEPWLAESYERVDEKTWRITLKEGISFTSGRVMDAEAVKECLEALVEANARAAGNLRLETVTAEGLTLTIGTKVPVPALLNDLADPYGCIYDVQAGVTEDGIVQGTGPYRAVALTTDTSLELVKNEQYWNGEPKIDRITVRTITDGDTLTVALQSGEIDVAYGMPYISYPLFENDRYTFTGCSTSRVIFGAMNFESAIMQDPAVRKAVSMGIDKEGFVETLLGGNGTPAAGPFPDTVSFGGDAVRAPAYDPEKAMQVLEEAGWTDTDGDGIREKDGTPLTIRWLTYPSRQEQPLLAEAAQAMLKTIGIRVEIQNTANHNQVRTDRSAWDIYVSTFVAAPTGDPEYFFAYHCLDHSGSNDGRYHSDRLESLAEKMEGTFDTDRRAELAQQMQQIILDDSAYIFFAHLRMNMISASNVTGLTAHPCDYYEITADLDIRE